MTFPDQITVSVDTDDIAAGQVGDAGSCPIALAVRRVFPAAQVRVGDVRLRLWDRDYTSPRVYLFPPDAEAFIAAFDAYEAVEPFTFTARLDADQDPAA